jgi:hypothetical protein
MGKGFTLLSQGKYEDAIDQLRRDAPRDWQDDYRVGAISHLGIAMLCAGRYAEAAEHFDSLIAAECRWGTTSIHFIYAGLARWFGRKREEAVSVWLAGRKADHFSYRGLDIPFVLYYAALRSPDAFTLADAEALIRKELPFVHPDDDPARYAAFLLGELGEQDFTAYMAETASGTRKRYWPIEIAALTDY